LEAMKSVAPGVASQAERVKAIEQHFRHLKFQSKHEAWDNFSRRIPELGAVVEAFVEGEEPRSPSVQGIITPSGKVEILSTHDQVLDDQIFLGCRFPADEAYRLDLQDLGQKVGEKLAQKGVLERFAIDFLAVRQPNSATGWDLRAIEANIRKGGTTHPFMVLRFLTNGHYDRSTGLFYSQQGDPKYYIALDNLQKEQYRGLLPSDLMDIIARHQLHFDTSTQTGSVFHLMGSLSEFGKLGVTSIGNSPQHADELYNKVVEALDQETAPTTFHPGDSAPKISLAWRK
ncbi:MAG TPA: peptide ligase PGM1-related protein, partial [Candidatus Caenarcaniphilales bacterium]